MIRYPAKWNDAAAKFFAVLGIFVMVVVFAGLVWGVLYVR